MGAIRATKLRFLALAVAAVMVTPAALAWACGPQAGIATDRLTFGPGQGGSITGVNFHNDMSVTFEFEGTAPFATVAVPDGGGFVLGFTAPQAPGTYNIYARGVDNHGNLQIRVAPIVVAAPQPASPSSPGTGSTPNGQPASAAQPGQTESGAGAQSGGPATAAPTPSTKRGGAKSGRNAGRAVPTRTANQIANSQRSGATAPNVVQTAGQSAPVFAGSAPLSATPTFSTGAAPAPARTGSSSRRGARATSPASGPDRPTPSESTAEGAAWGGMGSSADPALVPTGQFPESDASVNTTARTLSLLLLALGLAGLVGGVAVSERRRRRAL